MNKEKLKEFIEEMFSGVTSMADSVKKADAGFMKFCKENFSGLHVTDRSAIHQHLAAVNLAYTMTGIKKITNTKDEAEKVIESMIQSTIKEAKQMCNTMTGTGLGEGIEIKFGEDPELDKLVKELLKRALKGKETKDAE